MKVHELVEWLKQFPEQEAEVSVVLHKDSARDYYCQGGKACISAFDPAEGTFEAYTGVLILGRYGD